MSKIKQGLSVAVLIVTVCACGTGIEGGLSPSNIKFESVSNPAILRPGGSITFSVKYYDKTLELSGCTSTYGATSNTTTTCTYTAPTSLDISPSKGADGTTRVVTDHVVASIAHSWPVNLSATLTVNIIINEDGSCWTYEDCPADQLCYYGTCMAWASAGVNISATCNGSEDCSGGNPCVPFNTYDGCQGFCTDFLTFFNSSLNPPTTEEACNDVFGARWITIEGEGGKEYSFCITPDIASCIDEEKEEVCHGSIVHGTNHNEGCFAIRDKKTCQNSYIAYFSMEEPTRYSYVNCGWSSEDNACYIVGRSWNDRPCTGGKGGYPPDWINFGGTYYYQGETSSEACTPAPNGGNYNVLQVSGNLNFWTGIQFLGYPITYLFNNNSYDKHTGIASQELGYRIKVYLEDNTIKLIFIGTTGGAGYECINQGSGRVYVLQR